MSDVMRIVNGRIVTPDRVIDNGTLVMKNNQIILVEDSKPLVPQSTDIDAKGAWVLPGLIDSHSDAIEMELQPRPNSTFPMELSFYELEKKLVGEGITTIYHSLSLLNDHTKKWVRRNDTVFKIIDEIRNLSNRQYLINHKVHLRYEITNISAIDSVIDLLQKRKIDQISFMDHTPGQGQFRDMEVQKKYLMEHRHYSEQEAQKIIIDTGKTLEKASPETLNKISKIAYEQSIPLASHDDDTIEKLEIIKDWQAVISEFPIMLEVAVAAKQMGLHVVMGAPNVLLGRSHSNNLSANEAIQHGLVDILCSDYYPSSLLHAVFKLYHDGLTINEAINMVSYNPAKALGISDITGHLSPGKQADVLIVSEDQTRPVIEQVIVGGRLVCQMNYQTNGLHSMSSVN